MSRIGRVLVRMASFILAAIVVIGMLAALSRRGDGGGSGGPDTGDSVTGGGATAVRLERLFSASIASSGRKPCILQIRTLIMYYLQARQINKI